jgi:hypothetical protein
MRDWKMPMHAPRRVTMSSYGDDEGLGLTAGSECPQCGGSRTSFVFPLRGSKWLGGRRYFSGDCFALEVPGGSELHRLLTNFNRMLNEKRNLRRLCLMAMYSGLFMCFGGVFATCCWTVRSWLTLLIAGMVFFFCFGVTYECLETYMEAAALNRVRAQIKTLNHDTFAKAPVQLELQTDRFEKKEWVRGGMIIGGGVRKRVKFDHRLVIHAQEQEMQCQSPVGFSPAGGSTPVGAPSPVASCTPDDAGAVGAMPERIGNSERSTRTKDAKRSSAYLGDKE